MTAVKIICRAFVPAFSMVSLVLAAGCSLNGDEAAVTGQITAVTAAVGSRIGGRVAEVRVSEGQIVEAGDVLIRLESTEQEARLAAAKASLAQSEATLAKLVAGPRAEEIARADAAAARAEANYLMAVHGARSQEIDTARANAEAAKAQKEDAEVAYKRAQSLFDSGAASEQMRDQTKHAFETASARYEGAMEQLNLLLAGTRDEQIVMAKAAYAEAQAVAEEAHSGTREEDLAAARAARDAAAAQVVLAEDGLGEMVVEAPMHGVVELLDIHPGDLLPPGAAIRIADPERLELIVYVTAARLSGMEVGQNVSLSTDATGGERFESTITYIAPEGEFTPRNLQTTEDRLQQVFAVKVALDSNDGKLRAGMSATAHIANGHGV